MSVLRCGLYSLLLSAGVTGGAVLNAVNEVVTIEGGQVDGVVDRGVRVFKAIPYAAPPVGNLRWRPPQPVMPWKGLRNGSRFGPECPQTQYPDGSIYTRPLAPQSEDCLFLNVWTTAAEGDKQPVFVWIHGGALTKGSGISDTRDGVPFARQGVVLVTLNYRLGVLGYLAHPELTAESRHRSSGNYGVLDQIAALQWVQRNIASFGGDPARVTIGGESAGSWSVNTLLASPLAKGLFIRAIGQSGGRFSRTPHLNEDRGSQPSAESLGLSAARTLHANSLAELRAVPAEQIAALSVRTQENVDGWVLPDEIRSIFASKQQNNVPVVVGSTADEMTSFGVAANVPKTMEDFRKRIAQQYGEHARDFEDAYGVKSEADIAQAMLAVSRDTTFSSHMRSWARATTAAGSNAFLYYFTHIPPHPRAKELRAFHASEIPYVFNVVPSSDPRESGFRYTDADRRVAAAMTKYWVNFITSGNPNGDDLPLWPAYDLEREAYLEIADPISVGHHLLQRELDFLERALARRP